MITSNHPDPEIRVRANNMLHAASLGTHTDQDNASLAAAIRVVTWLLFSIVIVLAILSFFGKIDSLLDLIDPQWRPDPKDYPLLHLCDRLLASYQYVILASLVLDIGRTRAEIADIGYEAWSISAQMQRERLQRVREIHQARIKACKSSSGCSSSGCVCSGLLSSYTTGFISGRISK